MEKTIVIENLKKVYKSGFFKNKTIFSLKEISFEIQRGEIYGFLGPNGAGKTTTILLILNLIKRDGGKILLLGKENDKSKEIYKEIGYVPEEPFFYNYLKGEEILYLIGRLKGKDENFLKEKIPYFLEIFQLKEKGKRILKTYSKGEKQRLILAVNFLIEPEILILDEPFRGLDPIGVKIAKEEIERISKNGKTVFFSSHILSEVEMLCTKVGIINEGKMVWEGSPKEIYEKERKYKIFFKVPKEKEILFQREKGNLEWYERGSLNQEELFKILDLIKENKGEILQILPDKKLEDYFIEKVKGENEKH